MQIGSIECSSILFDWLAHYRVECCYSFFSCFVFISSINE